MVTKPDLFPLPHIGNLLDQFEKARYFSSLDLASGYWQIRLDPESHKKTAFITPTWVIWVLCNAVQTDECPSCLVSQSLMQQAFMWLNPESEPTFLTLYNLYIDDVLVFRCTFEEHLKHPKAVLDRLVEVS